MRPTHAEISLANLKYNYLNIRKKVKGSKLMPVVKADAYGHGMIECVKALEKLGKSAPEYYGVALLEEGIELRKSRIMAKPILTFSPFSQNELSDYYKYKVMPTFCSIEQISVLKRVALSRKLNVHVNVDTGMSRLGINYAVAAEEIKKLSSIKNVVIDGIYTHFATSDERDKKFANLQLQRFNKVIDKLRSDRVNFGLVHSANSGAILDMPDSYFDIVRPGVSLYGYYPSLETTESIKLKPVMSLKSKVTSIKQIKRDDTVSYGRRFTAKRSTKLASLPIGYADGLNRNLTNNISVFIKGRKFKQVGTITMDRVMINVGSQNVKVGDSVTLLGGRGKNKIDAWDWSGKLNTIPYEITCAISKRVPRIYKN